MPDPIMAEAPTRTPTKQAEPHVIERVVTERVVDRPIVRVVRVPASVPEPQEDEMKYVPIFFSSLWTSVVRTFVPQIVGIVMTFLVSLGIEFDSTIVTLAVMELFAVAYYLLIRGLEEFKDSKYGRFLGKAARPMYFEPHKES